MDDLTATPSVLVCLLIALAGGGAGHLARRSVPWWLGAHDPSLPFRWPWMEGVVAAVAGLAAWRLGAGGSTAGWFGFGLLLLTVAACDYRAKLIPDRLTLGGTVLGVLWSALAPERLLELPGQAMVASWLRLDELAPGVLGAGLTVMGALLGLLALEILRRSLGAAAGLEVMGFGDSKLTMLLGAFLGPAGVVQALVLAFLVGVVHGLVASWASGLPHSPFGPPLAAAGFTVALAGEVAVPALGTFQQALLGLPLGALAALYAVLLGIVVGLMLRVRRRAAHYEEVIEDDYRRIDEQLDGVAVEARAEARVEAQGSRDSDLSSL